ncbi:unnamed protein product [Sphagnum tenellum]
MHSNMRLKLESTPSDAAQSGDTIKEDSDVEFDLRIKDEELGAKARTSFPYVPEDYLVFNEADMEAKYHYDDLSPSSKADLVDVITDVVPGNRTRQCPTLNEGKMPSSTSQCNASTVRYEVEKLLLRLEEKEAFLEAKETRLDAQERCLNGKKRSLDAKENIEHGEEKKRKDSYLKVREDCLNAQENSLKDDVQHQQIPASSSNLKVEREGNSKGEPKGPKLDSLKRRALSLSPNPNALSSKTAKALSSNAKTLSSSTKALSCNAKEEKGGAIA